MSFGQRENVEQWSRKMGDLIDEMMSRSFVDFRDRGPWQPATNVYETLKAYYVCVELAGVDQDQIDLRCADRQRVTITGTRTPPRPDCGSAELSIHAMEVDEGPFRREIELPEPVNVDGIDATYSKGFLWVRIPRLCGG